MRHLCASAVVVLGLGMLGPPLSVGQMAATAPPPGAASKAAPSVGGGSTQRFFYEGPSRVGQVLVTAVPHHAMLPEPAFDRPSIRSGRRTISMPRPTRYC